MYYPKWSLDPEPICDALEGLLCRFCGVCCCRRTCGVATAHARGHGDETAGAAHFVAGELFVRTESVALQISVRSDNVHRDVGIKLVLLVVPIELLTGVGGAVLQISHAHSSTEFPEFLVIPVGCVGSDVEIYIEFGIVALQKDALEKFVARRMRAVKEAPFFCHNFIAHHA